MSLFFRNKKHRRFCLGFYAVLVMLLTVQLSHAAVYSNAINESSWRAKNSVLSCQMIHSIPNYGDAVFRTRAGEASGFYLRAKTSRFKAGEAKLVARSPIWVNDKQEEVLATVGMKQGKRPLWLNSTLTERMLSRLDQGLEVSIERDIWYEGKSKHVAGVYVTTIGFKAVYDKYLTCLSGLIPRNFDQLKRTALRFPAGETDKLPSSLTRQLDHILALIKHDKKLKLLYIDGHTDSAGDRDDNLELSKQRAEIVAQYLKRRGIPEDWLTVRWHGERYPMASNASAEGRARNRRVTVRLERIENVDIMPSGSPAMAAKSVSDTQPMAAK